MEQSEDITSTQARAFYIALEVTVCWVIIVSIINDLLPAENLAVEWIFSGSILIYDLLISYLLMKNALGSKREKVSGYFLVYVVYFPNVLISVLNAYREFQLENAGKTSLFMFGWMVVKSFGVTNYLRLLGAFILLVCLIKSYFKNTGSNQ